MAEAMASRRNGAPTRGLDESVLALGGRIRALRKSRGLTLTQVATEAGLSHSFLSQVERGVERLSMASLFRIAEALGTTQQALLVDNPSSLAQRGGRHFVFSADERSPLDSGGGPVTVLARDSPPFLPMLFSGSYDSDSWWTHDEEEFLLVLDGRLRVELDDAVYDLNPGDSTYYEGGVRHRWTTPDGGTCRLLVVKENHHHTP